MLYSQPTYLFASIESIFLLVEGTSFPSSTALKNLKGDGGGIQWDHTSLLSPSNDRKLYVHSNLFFFFLIAHLWMQFFLGLE